MVREDRRVMLTVREAIVAQTIEAHSGREGGRSTDLTITKAPITTACINPYKNVEEEACRRLVVVVMTS
jgi:hypothetical protein